MLRISVNFLARGGVMGGDSLDTHSFFIGNLFGAILVGRKFEEFRTYEGGRGVLAGI